MRVANPIYDTVFKHLMEVPEIASELISRLIGRRVLSLRQLPQETQQRAQGVDVEGAVLQVLRLDFAAEIELEDGSHKKVLIELDNEITDLYGRVLEAEAKADRIEKDVAATVAAKEQAVAAKEQADAAKEQAVAATEAERKAKEQALMQLEAMKEVLRQHGISPPQT